ncbi:PEP-CTERM sorting domain-containing protein [Azohydromonas lata]|uniref:PEP-CTERM sorting domain-containing protein n=1 Tax=Azohydromonas lata TaxID=45677 RepID=UPI0008350B50|nr:PEP-CTERM sorting domain-containing protein [Azohydromonas lata]
MQPLKHFIFLSGMALATTTQVHAAELKYRIEAIDVLSGGYATYATGFNDHGQVALTAQGQFEFGEGSRAFLYQRGQSTMIPLAAGLSSYSGDINNRGDMVGGMKISGSTRPFYYRNGKFVDIGATIGSDQAVLTALNDKGMVVGYAEDKSFLYRNGHVEYWKAESMAATHAFDINNRGTVVGGSMFEPDSNYLSFFTYRNGQLKSPSLPDYIWGRAGAINDSGQIVINKPQISWGETGDVYLYKDGKYTGINFFNGAGLDINEKGWVVGERGFFVPDEGYDCCNASLYRDGRTYILENLLTANASKNWNLYSAIGIDERGTIVGNGYLEGVGRRAFVMTPVPEASTYATMMAGLVAVGYMSRRKRRDKSAQPQ